MSVMFVGSNRLCSRAVQAETSRTATCRLTFSKMIGLAAFFLSSLLHLASSQGLLDDPCYLMTWNGQPDPDTQMTPLAVPDTCMSGDIHWNYPRGSLHVFATRPGSSFSLCVGQDWVMAVAEIRDITGGQNTTLPMPTTDHPACTYSQNGRADLQIVADNHMYYMTSIRYSIEPSATP